MRVLYVAPRYHTNQVPIMKGWIKEGHEVLFVSQLLGTGEDHRDIEPVILGYSSVFNCIFGIMNKLQGRKDADDKFRISSKAGFPPYSQMKKM